MSTKKTVLSGIQPTGQMHYGNYFGAVKNWVDLQEKYTCFYSVVDYHAMTMPYDPAKLRDNTWDLVINLLSVGINPENLFIQSLIPEHVELGWIFNCFASYAHVNGMPQFKDKSKQSEEQADGFISVGLFDYPVLQAADILLYRADCIPVGKDQDTHIELTRDIAQRFNNQMGKEYFALPESLYTATPSVKSTADPSKKMSKSSGEKHYIDVFAEDAVLRKQIKRAVTDGDTPIGEMSAGIANLFELLKACDKLEAHNSLMEDFRVGKLMNSALKDAVANALAEKSALFRDNKAKLLTDKENVKEQIRESSRVIRLRAKRTLKEVKELTGLLNPTRRSSKQNKKML